MTAYVVRNMETRLWLGVFVAPSMEDLWDLVDESGADPGGYEWCKVTFGALAAHGEAEFPPPCFLKPRRFQRDEYDVENSVHCATPPTDVEFSETMRLAGQWTAFDCASEGVGLIARVLREAEDARDVDLIG